MPPTPSTPFNDLLSAPHGAVGGSGFPPALGLVPTESDLRLIETACIHHIASNAGFAERYGRGVTPHTIHVWWARRPYSAMRSLVFACLASGRSAEMLELLQAVGQSALAEADRLQAARAALHRDGQCPPRVLDMFGGGGTIALEAASLGADASSIDTNELAAFIQKNLLADAATIEPSKLAGHLETSGQRVLDSVRLETAAFFPQREHAFAYFWTYSLPCPRCGFRFFLAKRHWLSKKKQPGIALAIHSGQSRQTIDVVGAAANFRQPTAWTGRKSAACPRCRAIHENVSLDEVREELVAVAGPGPNGGKHFAKADSLLVPDWEALARREGQLLAELGLPLPASQLPRWSGIVNPALYGMRTHADIFNPRQRVVTLTLAAALRREHQRLASAEGADLARSVTGLLSGLMDQTVDWNCRLSMWIAQNEQVGRAFCGPGVPMLWDYVETDPLQHGPANLWSKLQRIVSGSCVLRELQRPVHVERAAAQKLPFADEQFDAIVTDPPYYDNLYYTALADFFYSWKRLALHSIEPELFRAPATSSERELVASTFRNGDAQAAHDEYCRNLTAAFHEAQRVLKPDGIFALVYSHGSLRGWQALLGAFRQSNLWITSVPPLRIERRQRPRAMNSAAINTCLVFVARRNSHPKPAANGAEFNARLREIAGTFGKDLDAAGWPSADAGLAVFAQGVGLLANTRPSSNNCDEESTLREMAKIVQEAFPQFRLTNRNSL